MQIQRVLRLAAALLVLALLVPAGASAQDEEATNDFTRDGWYLQGSGVYAIEQFQRGYKGDNGWGFNLLGGYRMGQNFAGEFEFEFVDRMNLTNSGADSVRLFDVALSGRIYPLARLFDPDSLASRFQPYVKAGAGWAWSQENGELGLNDRDGGFVAPLGGGLDIYITNNFVLTLAGVYHMSTGKLENFRYVSTQAGFAWRFGTPDY